MCVLTWCWLCELQWPCYAPSLWHSQRQTWQCAVTSLLWWSSNIRSRPKHSEENNMYFHISRSVRDLIKEASDWKCIIIFIFSCQTQICSTTTVQVLCFICSLMSTIITIWPYSKYFIPNIREKYLRKCKTKTLCRCGTSVRMIHLCFGAHFNPFQTSVCSWEISLFDLILSLCGFKTTIYTWPALRKMTVVYLVFKGAVLSLSLFTNDY